MPGGDAGKSAFTNQTARQQNLVQTAAKLRLQAQCVDQILGFDKPFAKQARGKGKCRPLILARWSGNQPQRSPSRASGGGGQACTCQS